MMNRKNAFSYIMWFVYSMAVCVSLFAIGATLSVQAGYAEAVGYGICAVWLVLGGLIVFLVHKLAGNFIGSREGSKIPALVAESLIAVILVAVGIILRVRGLAGAGEDAAYYELTKVAEGQTIPAVVHGASYIYLQLLHLVYWLFGNKFIAGIWLQIILQMIAAFFLYRAVRKKSGVIASLIAFGFVMVGPLMVKESLALSPELLILAVFGIVLYLCIRCICGSKSPVMALLTGLLISVVCYLDICGVVLLLFMIVGLLQETGDEDRSLPGRLLSVLLCFVGCGVGFVLLMLIDSLASGKSLGNVIFAWWELYAPVAFQIPEYLKISSVTMDVLALLLVMTLGIFGYWCSFFNERQSAWILSACALVALQLFGMTTAETNGYLLLYILFAVLAGVGITDMFGFGDDDDDMKPLGKMVRKEEKETEMKGRGKVAEQEVVVSGRGRIIAAEPKPVEPKAEVPKAEEFKAEASKAEVSATQKPKVKYLENPLPLPKKHVKKTLDYDYDVVAGQDDYDLLVDDNDDYDI